MELLFVMINKMKAFLVSMQVAYGHCTRDLLFHITIVQEV